MDKAKEALELRDRIVGVLLRKARERAGKSMTQCAELLGISSGLYGQYEGGKRPVSLPELEALAYFLQVPVTTFWDEQVEQRVFQDQDDVPVEETLALRQRIVGALVRQARLNQGATQQDLADALGCPVGRISSYEYGERAIPISELELIAQHLHVTVEYFLDQYQGPLGAWQREREAFEQFSQLSENVRTFVLQPINQSYLEVAIHLARMPAGALRSIAEGLLEITY